MTIEPRINCCLIVVHTALSFCSLFLSSHLTIATEHPLALWLAHEKNHFLVGDQPHDLFGWSVAVHVSEKGTIIAVGAIDNDTNGSAAGQVRLYREDMLPETMGVIQGEKAGDYFGYSTSLSSSSKATNGQQMVAIGAPGHAGKVYVFRKFIGESGWTQMGTTMELNEPTTSSMVGSSPGLGHIVALSEDGQTLAAGAPYYDNDRGLVLVFHYDVDKNDWKETGRLVGEEEGSQFGYAVAMAGSILAVGAKNHGTKRQGQVQVFQREEGNANNTWALAAPAIHGEKANDYFGFSLSLSADGKILAVGAPYFNTHAGSNAGLVQVYELHISDDASQVCRAEDCSFLPGELIALGQSISGNHGGDFFGYSVSLASNGYRLAIGARQVQGLRGQVKLYDWEETGGTWDQGAMPINGEARTDQSGFSVVLSGDGEALVIGSPYHDATTLRKPKSKPNAGQARIFYRKVVSPSTLAS